MQDIDQKKDVQRVLGSIKEFNNLDYIACWFLLGAKYIRKANAQFAFVSTNSICQGTQVSIIWPHILNSLEIFFAHQSFKWANNAKGNAGVTCVIVGARNITHLSKFIYNDNIKREAKKINPYLTATETYYVKNRRTPLSKLPSICFGSMANDGGNLFLNKSEYENIVSQYSDVECLIRKVVGSKEFINNLDRFCFWIEEENKNFALTIPCVNERINLVREHREASKRKATKELSSFSYRFGEVRHKDGVSIILPKVSSERRDYIPIGFLDKDTVITDLAFAIYDPPPYIFAIISSRMHMTWVRTVAGRLKTDYRYSSALCYNTFPFPEISDKQKRTLEDHVFNVLDEREQHSEKTLAQLYDPDKMPDGLRLAHHEMDMAVEKCYRSKPFKNDEERLEYLFKLYEKMIEDEKK